jgi:hypothetical protein
MAILRLVVAVQDACLTPIKTAIDAGGGAGIIEIYTASIPADPSVAITTQTKLGTLTFSDPCGTVAANALTMSAITQDSSADATGTAAWARIKDSTGATVGDIDVTSTGGGGLLQLNTVNVVIGGPIIVTSFVLNVA